jgi:LPXTG-site transpeptidase (sortase) family protein
MSSIPKNKHQNRKLASYMLMFCLMIGLFLVVLGGWRYLSHLQDLERYKKEVAKASGTDASLEDRQLAEGKDETKPSGEGLESYRVGAAEPRFIFIDKLGVQSKVLPMGLNPDKSIQSPVNIYDTGWYTGSAKPGEGAVVVIDGHASGPTREGIFAYLDTLVAGDQIGIEKGDGTRLNYAVVRKQELALEQTDMSQIMQAPMGEEWLNLITCSGNWIKDKTTFDKRTIVYSRRVL